MNNDLQKIFETTYNEHDFEFAKANYDEKQNKLSHLERTFSVLLASATGLIGAISAIIIPACFCKPAQYDTLTIIFMIIAIFSSLSSLVCDICGLVNKKKDETQVILQNGNLDQYCNQYIIQEIKLKEVYQKKRKIFKAALFLLYIACAFCVALLIKSLFI